MILPLAILLMPIAVAVAMCFIRNVRLVGRMVAAGSVLQLLFLLIYAMPLLMGHVPLLFIRTSFFLTKIDAAFSILTSVVAAAVFVHGAVFYERELFSPKPPASKNIRINHACAMFLVLAMYSVFLSKSLVCLWIAVELTMLFSTPLVYFARTRRALDVTWKYLLVNSIGMVFAFLGTLFVFASSQHGAINGGTLSLLKLIEIAPQLDSRFLSVGFMFCLLGYGTSAGIVPLHGWLPDAHSESPAPSSALLASALLNCALFAIWRVSQVLQAAHHGTVGSDITVWTGTATILASSFFLIRQSALKRFVAYSSIGHVGMMLIAIGLNSGPLFFLQALNHSLAKSNLFLLSGNIIQATWKKNLCHHHGLLQNAPVWAVLFILSTLSMLGAPPFGTFLAEWLILTRSVEQNYYVPAALCLLGLSLSYIAVCVHVGKVIFGAPTTNFQYFRPMASSLVPSILILFSLVLGVTSGSTIWKGLL